MNTQTELKGMLDQAKAEFTKVTESYSHVIEYRKELKDQLSMDSDEYDAVECMLPEAIRYLDMADELIEKVEKVMEYEMTNTEIGEAIANLYIIDMCVERLTEFADLFEGSSRWINTDELRNMKKDLDKKEERAKVKLTDVMSKWNAIKGVVPESEEDMYLGGSSLKTEVANQYNKGRNIIRQTEVKRSLVSVSRQVALVEYECEQLEEIVAEISRLYKKACKSVSLKDKLACKLGLTEVKLNEAELLN